MTLESTAHSGLSGGTHGTAEHAVCVVGAVSPEFVGSDVSVTNPVPC